MDHIYNFDWCMSVPDTDHFLTEADIDNSCTEKILRNKFVDPLASSDSENEEGQNIIDWDKIFNITKNDDKVNRVFVPGLRSVPQYPKLSRLDKTQHWQCLKVICCEYPDVLEAELIPRPSKLDHKVFEEIKPIYLAEQTEFANWAKVMWSTTHCIRALRPKPQVELVYDAEFKMKETELQSLPKMYEMVAQIPLTTPDSSIDLVHKKDLIKVSMTELPLVQFPDMLSRKVNIIRPNALPEPCLKHPCRFVLPSESSISILPLTEVHKELAQYTADNGARYIASEGALRCLVQTHRPYLIPVTVCNVVADDGDNHNIVVIGNEFSINRESSTVRTYRAFRHLLLNTLIPYDEKARIHHLKAKMEQNNRSDKSRDSPIVTNIADLMTEDESDIEDDNLFIDTDTMQLDILSNGTGSDAYRSELDKIPKSPNASINMGTQKSANVPELFACTCEDTSYENPPPRSFRRWQVRSQTDNDNFDLIVHCSHKIKGKSGDIVLEPIPEYQIDLGATEQSIDTIRSQALSLLLRKNATALNVRVDGPTGDLVTYENINLTDIIKKHENIVAEVSNVVHTALDQLQGLLPGNYLLKHDSEHGPNALLFAARRRPPSSNSVTLNFDVTTLAEPDESKCLKKPPVLVPVLLPMHKSRKILPMAFTPFPDDVAPEPKNGKKPASRQKTPPQAIKWPKKRGKGKKKKNHN